MAGNYAWSTYPYNFQTIKYRNCFVSYCKDEESYEQRH